MTDVARDHRPGHIGYTPQDTFETLVGARVAGELADFDEHLEPSPQVSGYMPLPADGSIVVPGYFRDDTFLLQITGASARMQPGVMRAVPTAKTLGGYDPLTDD